MGEGSIPIAPIWDDVKTLRGDMFNVPIDIIIAGFPCQDISVAGRGAGLAGQRSGLFFEVVRLAKEIKPTFLFLENVPAIRTRGLDVVIQELAEAGYDCRWCMLSAAEVGAPHKRDRWFALAYRNDSNCADTEHARREPAEDTCRNTQAICQSKERTHRSSQPKRMDTQRNVAHTNNTRLEGRDGSIVPECAGEWVTWASGSLSSHRLSPDWWETEPLLGRVADGVSDRVERLKRLGNGVVPLQAKTAFEELMGILKY